MTAQSPEVSSACQSLVEALEGLRGSRRQYLAALLMRMVKASEEGSVDRVFHCVAALAAAVERDQQRRAEELDPDDDGVIGAIVVAEGPDPDAV